MGGVGRKILKNYFSRLGTLLFDKDVKAITILVKSARWNLTTGKPFNDKLPPLVAAGSPRDRGDFRMWGSDIRSCALRRVGRRSGCVH
jgi:hypothetical protein